jgi:hypothetical protein
LKGNNKIHGTIIHIEKDFNKIKWQGTRALFIEVLWDNNQQVFYAPGQLKKINT